MKLRWHWAVERDIWWYAADVSDELAMLIQEMDQHYGGMIAHCDSDTAKESFSRPVYGSRQELEDPEQEKYLAEWNKRLKERKKRK